MAGPKLLESYNDERLPVIAEMLRQTAGLYVGAFGKESERVEPFSDWARNRALFMLGINYRWSNIILDEREQSTLDPDTLKAHSYGGYENVIHAGDRAPEAPGLLRVDSGKIVSLFDLLNPTQHTVLIFAPSHSSSANGTEEFVRASTSLNGNIAFTAIITNSDSTLKTSGADLILRDTEGYAHKHYDISGEKSVAVIIRPDSYIGGICVSVNGFDNYFNKIFDKAL